MKYGRNQRGSRKPMSDINVVPLVDVILVLLLIFMVAAPMLQMGIDVNLPRVVAQPVDVGEEKLVLTINADREIYINRHKATLADLNPKLESIFAARIDRDLYMRADETVPYGFVVQVMSEVRKAGVDRLGMITDPPKD